MKDDKKVKKFLTEIRFTPNPQLIDSRGQLASLMISDEFRDWVISDNRIEVLSKEGKVFLSYRNAGFETTNQDEIPKLIEKLNESLRLFENYPPIRWGVRIFSYEQKKQTFKTLRSVYEIKLLRYDPKKFSFIDGNLVDLGISYVFKKDADHYHLTSGPMEEKQASSIFHLKDLPKVGIFTDLDIYREKDDFYKADFRLSRITEFIKQKLEEGPGIIDKFSKLISNGK